MPPVTWVTVILASLPFWPAVDWFNADFRLRVALGGHYQHIVGIRTAEGCVGYGEGVKSSYAHRRVALLSHRRGNDPDAAVQL